MILLPIGIDETKLSRHPLVTWSLIGLCFAVWLFGSLNSDIKRRKAINETLRFYFEHPYLELPESFLQFLQQNNLRAALDIHRSLVITDEMLEERTPTNLSQLSLEQEQLERSIDDLMMNYGRDFSARWGFIPAQFNPLKLLSYAFVHAGFMHLLGNMLFFFFTAPFLEDRWGRGFFASFYLLAAVLSGAAFWLASPETNIPLVGASGAISAVMGAFLIKFTKRKFNFVFFTIFFYRIFHTTFSVPAWLVIGLMIGLDLMMFNLVGTMSPVAHITHLSGFGFGILIALVLRATPLGRSLNNGTFDPDFPELHPLEAAHYFNTQGKAPKALLLLQNYLNTDTQARADTEVLSTYWNLAVTQGALPHIQYAGRLQVQNEIAERNPEAAYAYWKVLLEQKRPLRENDGRPLLSLLLESDLEDEADEVLRFALQSNWKLEESDFQHVAAQAHRWDLETLRLLLVRQEIDPPGRSNLRKALQDKERNDPKKPPEAIEISPMGPEPFMAPPHESTIQHGNYPKSDYQTRSAWSLPRIVLIPCKVRKIETNELLVETAEHGRQTIPLTAVKALSLARIQDPSGWTLIADILLDPPQAPAKRHRILRVGPWIEEERSRYHRVIQFFKFLLKQGIVQVQFESERIYASINEYERSRFGKPISSK